MSLTLVLMLCSVSGADCHLSDDKPPLRSRTIHAEIEPASVEHSVLVKTETKTETKVVDGSKAVDLNFTTSATASAEYGTYPWIRLNFTKLHCISRIIRFERDSSIRHSFDCENARFNCKGPNCDKWKIIIGNNPEDKSTLMDLPDCKKGNWVKLQTNWKDSSPSFHELAVFGTAFNSTRSDVDDGTGLEEVYWSLVGLFSMSSTTLGILLVLKYNSNLPILVVRLLKRCCTPIVERLFQCIYKFCSSNNAEDEQECDIDIDPAPNDEDDAQEPANDGDCALELPNDDDGAPEATNSDGVSPGPTNNDNDALEPEPIYTIPHCHPMQQVRDISSSASSSQSDSP